MKFPKHVNFTLEHNPHAIMYQSVQAYVQDTDQEDCWVSDRDKDLAELSNQLWEFTWHPDTPVGSCTVLSATLDSLLAHLEGIE